MHAAHKRKGENLISFFSTERERARRTRLSARSWRRKRTSELEKERESRMTLRAAGREPGSLKSRKEGTGRTGGEELDGTTLKILRRQRCNKDREARERKRDGSEAAGGLRAPSREKERERRGRPKGETRTERGLAAFTTRWGKVRSRRRLTHTHTYCIHTHT